MGFVMKPKVWIHKAKSFEEAQDFDAHFWRRAGAGARFETAWSMVGDFLKMRGKSLGQQRLRRSIQNIKRLQN